ncbi:MAG: hypothetical protein M3R27_15890 [Bacteroidota bacterium]|nr:hypothetical protein [Bacteroidota bacterium]
MKTRDFYLKAKARVLNLIPNKKIYHYNKEKNGADDIYYDLDIYPQYSFSYPLVELVGNILIKNKKEVGVKHYLSLKFSCYDIQQKNAQKGIYEGGIAQYFFNGEINENNKLNFISQGVGYLFHKNLSKKIVLELSPFIQFNWNFSSTYNHLEKNNLYNTSINYYRKTSNKLNKNSYYTSLNFAAEINCKIKKMSVGLFASSSLSDYYIFKKAVSLNNLSFLRYYNTIELGVSINLLYI